MQETQIRTLVWEDPLEKEMATHSSILAWRIPCTEEPGKLQSMGSQKVGHDCAHALCYLEKKRKKKTNDSSSSLHLENYLNQNRHI